MTLTTRYEATHNRVTIEVADTGPGIPPPLQTRIFVMPKNTLDPVMKKRTDFMKDKPPPAEGTAKTPGSATTPAISADSIVPKITPGSMPPKPGGKIEAVIHNARRAREMVKSEGSLAAFFWKYSPDAKPMTRARVGTYQHWRIVNQSQELHPFHIHQVHFLAYAVNGLRMTNPEWLDTVNVPYGGTVDVIMDFTNPVIRGMSLFHCHLLNHEDKGMMAKIAFE